MVLSSRVSRNERRRDWPDHDRIVFLEQDMDGVEDAFQSLAEATENFRRSINRAVWAIVGAALAGIGNILVNKIPL